MGVRGIQSPGCAPTRHGGGLAGEAALQGFSILRLLARGQAGVSLSQGQEGQMPPHGLLRLLRSLIFTEVTVGLAAAGHLVSGGNLPAPMII
jgi:hypothetical protein